MSIGSWLSLIFLTSSLDKEEVKNIKDNQDPIDMIKEMLIQGGHATQDDLKSIDKDIKKIVQESADFAIASPEPDLNELYTDILV